MILNVIVAISIVILIIGFVFLYRELLTKSKRKTALPWKIEYMRGPKTKLDVVSADFDSSHMATIECDGTPIRHDEGSTCIDGDVELCEPSPYKLLAFFDYADGYLNRTENGDYDCITTPYSGGCDQGWFDKWKDLRKGTQALTKCPEDESAYPLIGRCYIGVQQTGEAIDKAKRYIELNDLKCER
jgi:hypothetical protein